MEDRHVAPLEWSLLLYVFRLQPWSTRIPVFTPA
jgi:hypothetical protein